MNKSHWNHRVIVTEYIHKDGFVEKTYAIHEVYYNSDGKLDGCTMTGISAIGDTVEDLKITLDRMLKACTLPVLNYDIDFPESKDEDDV